MPGSPPVSWFMREPVKQLALSIKGFLSPAEGMCLYELALESSKRAPCLEIGSYCGKSSIYLAEACRVIGRHPLICVDHHRGSVEQQPGQLYFDPELYDEKEGLVTTLDWFMRNIRLAGLMDWVIPVVTSSALIGRYWQSGSLSLIFIDGSHVEADILIDYSVWSPCLMRGGYLCFHDIFTDPADGGLAPYHVFQHALHTGKWRFIGQVETLGILKRR